MKFVEERNNVPTRGQVERFVDDVQAEGRYSFDAFELASAVSLTTHGVDRALTRLQAAGRIARPLPKRGFFVVVPPEFRTLGSPPLTWYIDPLMRFLQVGEYYVGLLTAAEWHGAAHYAIQEAQIITPRQLRPVTIGRERIRFVRKREAERTPVDAKLGETGTVRVSTPEATAVDLVRYPRVSGGLSVVATALAELQLRPNELRRVLGCGVEISVAQRLGYLLAFVRQDAAARQVAVWLAAQPRVQLSALVPTRSLRDGTVAQPWNLLVNADVEVAV